MNREHGSLYDRTPRWLRLPLITLGIIVALFFLTAPLHPWIIK